MCFVVVVVTEEKEKTKKKTIFIAHKLKTVSNAWEMCNIFRYGFEL